MMHLDDFQDLISLVEDQTAQLKIYSEMIHALRAEIHTQRVVIDELQQDLKEKIHLILELQGGTDGYSD